MNNPPATTAATYHAGRPGAERRGVPVLDAGDDDQVGRRRAGSRTVEPRLPQAEALMRGEECDNGERRPARRARLA
ncbi:MAG: hypothetical protein M3R63_10945 [Actinomycetota bacterium]|nr:hypothetical protein [Actinomycetota bacterium]